MSRFVIRATVILGALMAFSAAAAPPTPKDPKSPIPDCVDGRGPTGPVEVKLLSPTPNQMFQIPDSPPGQPPAKGAVVEVKLEVKNFETFLDAKTQCGQGIAIVFDNLAASVHYEPSKPWAFRNVPKGTHTIRVFAVRPWGESIKEPGAFAMATFNVVEADGRNTPDPKLPLLTVSRPKGKYPKGQNVFLDFFVTGCTVADHTVPDSCRVRYRIGDFPEVILDKPDPVWLKDLPVGKHAFIVGLTRDGKLIDGPFSLFRGVFEVVEGAPAP
ncbi:MAG: hypothetical protein ACHQPI_05865 [Thermoanaerobaculia bacterium]